MADPIVRTGGVDLAAQSKRTALAVVEWSAGTAHLVSLEVGATDERIVSVSRGVVKLGIDCAFGWPDEFVEFVSRHRRGEPLSADQDQMAWRRTLAYRETDRFTQKLSGRWPLSVSTDRLGLTAMHCATLLDRLASDGQRIDRSGAEGLVAEVYPGATLRTWGWRAPGYRTEASVRGLLVERMLAETPQLNLGPHAQLMTQSADALDSVVAAFAARAASLRAYTPPPPESAERAEREGWIVIPSLSLSELVLASGSASER